MEWIVFWLIAGLGSTMFCDWVTCLQFEREQVTLVTYLAWALGTMLPPLTMFFASISLLCWAFSVPSDCRAVQWPDWWGRFRLRQHRLCRHVKYLGHPPEAEHVFGWKDKFIRRWS